VAGFVKRSKVRELAKGRDRWVGSSFISWLDHWIEARIMYSSTRADERHRMTLSAPIGDPTCSKTSYVWPGKVRSYVHRRLGKRVGGDFMPWLNGLVEYAVKRNLELQRGTRILNGPDAHAWERLGSR